MNRGTPDPHVADIGRSELVWPNKYTADGRRADPEPLRVSMRTVERHGDQGSVPLGPPPGGANLLFRADNEPVLWSLLDGFAGAVDLIYVDPPFGTGAELTYAPDPSAPPTPAYSDAWPGGLDGYLSMLAGRLALMRELLASGGAIYVHVDPGSGHYVKVLLDEVFGRRSFIREIVWRIGWISGYKSTARNWVRNHDLIFFYVRDPARYTFNKTYVPHPKGYRRRGEKGPSQSPGLAVEDVWNANPAELALSGDESLDSIQIKSFSSEKTGYATQKNQSLLRRIISASSNPGDLVADFFCGSGTTPVVAERLGRRWIGCDSRRLAVHLTKKRLLALDGCRPFEVVAPAQEAGAEPGPQVQVWARRSGETVVVGLTGETDAVDYWAVDWHGGDVLAPDWTAARLRTRRLLPLEAPPHTYPCRGRHQIRIAVADAVGNETLVTLGAGAVETASG